MKNGNDRPTLLRTRQQIVVVLRLIIFTVIYLIALQEHKLHDLPWLVWLILGIFVVSEVAYLLEHQATFFIQRILGWIFLFDAVLITLLIFLLEIKAVELYIAYFTVVAIATMTKSVATSFIITLLASAFYLFAPMYRGNFNFNEFITRPLFFFAVSMFSGYLSEVVYHQHKKKAEAESRVREIEIQLRQAQKMEVVGQLSGGIAHDFNNILATVMGYADMALMELMPSHPHYNTFTTIKKQSERGANLVKRLLAFSRQQVLDVKTVNVNDIIMELNKFISRTIPEDIEVKITPDGNLKPIKADPVALEQILLNLYVNARDAMPKGGRLTIATANVKGGIRDEHFIENTIPSGNGANFIALAVTDTGIGMTDDVKSRLFTPFFTTKEQGKGTGLGLAMVYGLVKQHNGHVEVESTPNKGTTFRIFLPIFMPQSGSAAAEPAGTATAILARGGAETILIAEDDPSVREMAEMILKTCGYSIFTAADGDEALSVFNKHWSKINLVILDMVMPKKNGYEVYEILKEVKPDTRTLFISGYAVSGIHNDFILKEGLDFIQKPFNIITLRQKVREILDRKEPDLTADKFTLNVANVQSPQSVKP